MNGRMDGPTDGQMENLPILQDFVPYRGRCPAAAQFQPKNCVKRGKGTADHMMPLGDWLGLCVAILGLCWGSPMVENGRYANPR